MDIDVDVVCSPKGQYVDIVCSPKGQIFRL